MYSKQSQYSNTYDEKRENNMKATLQLANQLTNELIY